MFERYDEILRAMREFEKIKNHPEYQALMEHPNQMLNDPVYRQKIEIATSIQNDSARTILSNYKENKHLYRQITELQLKELNNPALKALVDLRDILARNDGELWLRSDVLNSAGALQKLNDSLGSNKDLIPIFLKFTESEDEEINDSKKRAAYYIVQDFYENRVVAEQELQKDERLVIFIKLGKKEFRISDLAVEEDTNKIAAFLDDEKTSIIYCSPVRVNYRFYKEKILS